MINFIDVGCADALIKPWRRNKKYINYIVGFDPVGKINYIEEEFEKGKSYRIAIFNKEGKYPFYICKRTQNSSFLKPNYPIVEEHIRSLNKVKKNDSFEEEYDNFRIVEIIQMECSRLDSILDKLNINFDFLKVDTQGTEFNVIKSLGKYLDAQIVGIQAELCSKIYYKDVVLVDDVTQFLQEHNFYMVKKFYSQNKIYNDYLYLREDKNKKEQIKLIKEIYKIE